MKNINNNISTLKNLNTTYAGILTLLVSILIPSHYLMAAEEQCKLQPASIISKDTFSADGKTHLQSDSVEINEENISRFKGNVVIQQQDMRIETQKAEYIKTTEQVEAQGNVRFVTPSIQVKSETASFNFTPY